jgi:hypothetical protein
VPKHSVIVFLLVGVFQPLTVCCQQNIYLPTYFTAYYQNLSQITPAHVSDEGKAEFASSYKSLTGAFRKISSYNFSASRTFRNEKERAHVIRAQFFNEHEGSYITNPRVYLNYAYQIPLTETLKAFSGVSFGTAGVYYSAPTTTQSSFFLPDASFGLGLKNHWFEVGTSAMQLFNGSFTPVANPVLMKRYYHAYGSIQKEWPSEWMIKGYALGRFVPSVSSEYFGAFSISYAKQVTLGTSIKYGAGLSFFTMLGIDNKEDKLQLLLNYNSPFFGLIPAYQSNIEIGLAYLLE